MMGFTYEGERDFFFFLILGDLIHIFCPPHTHTHSTYISHISVAHTQNTLHIFHTVLLNIISHMLRVLAHT